MNNHLPLDVFFRHHACRLAHASVRSGHVDCASCGRPLRVSTQIRAGARVMILIPGAPPIEGKLVKDLQLNPRPNFIERESMNRGKS